MNNYANNLTSVKKIPLTPNIKKWKRLHIKLQNKYLVLTIGKRFTVNKKKDQRL